MISSTSPKSERLRAPGPSSVSEGVCCERGEGVCCVLGENAPESCPVELDAEPDTRDGSGNPVEGASKPVEGAPLPIGGGRSASGGIS